MMTSQQQSLTVQADTLYEQYAKPLEKTRWGKFIAVSPTGQTILGDSLLELMEQAKAKLGPGNFIFKIGDRAVGKWL
jgi:hypothetical protein